MIATPAAGNTVPAGVHWCADNSAYAGKYPGDDKYLAWLARHAAHAPRCAFATAPDVVGDAAATMARSTSMLARIRDAGYPAALVAQDSLEHHRPVGPDRRPVHRRQHGVETRHGRRRARPPGPPPWQDGPHGTGQFTAAPALRLVHRLSLRRRNSSRLRA
jgi:hypothetical protein